MRKGGREEGGEKGRMKVVREMEGKRVLEVRREEGREEKEESQISKE